MKSTHILIAAVLLAGSVFLMAQETNQTGNLTNIVTQFDSLKEPKITTRPNEKVIVVEARGDPSVIGSKAFGLLFQIYGSIKETPKGPMQIVPRARWPVYLDRPKSVWIGMYALPVPESVTSLPQFKADPDLKVTLTQWQYGLVAEMLYVGPYDKEESTLKYLNDFIVRQGYRTFGGHEEEYIVGPGMNGQSDPEKYVTILRYRLRKTGTTTD